MAITKMSNSGIATGGSTKYDDMLAGNPAYDPAAFFLIQRVAGDGSATTITFSSIPQTYTSLQIRSLSRNLSGGSGNANLNLRFNSDSGTNYTRHYLRGNGSTVDSYGDINASVAIAQDADLNWSASSVLKAASIIDIQDYNSTSKYKTMRCFAGENVNDVGYGVAVAVSSSLWLNTAAISTITIQSSGGSAFDSTSTFALYGMVG